MERYNVTSTLVNCLLAPEALSFNVRLYAVGRGISASYESFRPTASGCGERNPQYAVEPRLPYTALLAVRCYL
jgi:hypothetical protein